jgi:putative SOS response-associated peptidase YedK
MAEIHDRMPVVLEEKDYAVWLGEAEGDPATLLKPCPAEWLKVWKVSARVGSVKNNDLNLLEEIS